MSRSGNVWDNAAMESFFSSLKTERTTRKMYRSRDEAKARESARYSSEDESGFTYLLRPDDLTYWRGSNLPIILVVYRKSDETYFWKEVGVDSKSEERKLQFDKQRDVLDASAVDRLAALTVPKAGFGYYVPPLGGGEEALVNILPLTLPDEIFVSSIHVDATV